MERNVAPDTARERLLDELVTGYLKAAEAGQVPDRQALLDSHPDLAAELREFFADQDLLNQLASPLRAVREPLDTGTAAGGDAEKATPPSLGDYELLAEIGRGGMGVVFRARQRSLGRLVALKVIHPGRWLSAAEAQRFRNEAETAAHLDHPHVVPVHETGEHNGILYFSMRLVEGGSLAAQLKRFAADPRAAARLVSTVARAVHHAHQRGILHRNLKPANILLDAEGRPQVADFGLAKRVASPGCEPGETGLTQSGTLVGTPGYMAPEQTTGRKGAVTVASDVYGLGAVLYALLTGRPPFQADTVLETLERVKQREPEPPRRSNPGVGRDLETICLKCLHKDPARRYESAQALAEDLERYLAGESIRARRSGVWERGRKWVRHRPALAALVAVSAATLLLLLGGLLWHNAQLQAAATREHVLAERAQRERDAAREQRRQARKAVEDMYTDVAQKWLGQQPRLTEVQRDFLLKALRYYQEFVQDEDPDPDIRRDKAMAFVRVAEIQRTLGQFDESEAAFGQAIALWEQLAAEFPASAEYLQNVARSRYSMAKAIYEKGRYVEAQDLFQKALGTHDELATKFPDQPTYRRDLAAACLSVSIVLYRRNQYEPAEKLLNRSLDLYNDLTTRFPDTPVYREDLMLAYDQKGNLVEEGGRLDEAASARRQASRIGEKLVEDFPGEPRYRDSLVMVYNNLTNALLEIDQRDEAEKVNRKALKLAEGLVADFPAIREHRKQLARCHQHAAELLQAGGHCQEALQELRKAVQTCPEHALLLDSVARDLLTSPDPRYREPAWALELADKAVQAMPENAGARSTRALAHYRMGDSKAALTDLEKARQLRNGASGSLDLFLVVLAHWQLGDKERARREHDLARQWMDKNMPRDKDLSVLRAEAADVLGIKDRPAPDKEVSPPKDK